MCHITSVSVTAIATVFVFSAAGCHGIVNEQARTRLFERLGGTSVTVFPTAVRTASIAYDPASAERIAAFLTEEDLATVTVSETEVPITQGWHMNQARMLRESAADFEFFLGENPVDTEYAFLAECLILGSGKVGGIHCYLLTRDGAVAFAVLLNSHHDVFSKADPQTVDDCTAVLVEKLRGELVGVEE